MKKSINYFLFTITVIFSTFASSETVTASSYAGGDGTEANPYQISNLAELRRLSETSIDWDKHFILTADIDMNNKEIEPIGNMNTPFSGSLSGNSFNINNLSINLPDSDSVGLFGWISGATLDDIRLINVQVTGHWDVGSLVGFSNSSSITSCRVIGVVKAFENGGGLIGKSSDSAVDNCQTICSVSGNAILGGILGAAASSSIKNCSSRVAMDGKIAAGGIIGDANSTVVKNCHATGSIIISEDIAGGLIASLQRYQEEVCIIENSFASVEVNGPRTVGGLVGVTQNSQIVNCYATGKITGSDVLGALVASCYDSSTIVTNSYWDKDTTGLTESIGNDPSCGLATTDFLTKDFSSEWNFGNDEGNPWQDDGNTSFPRLYWQKLPEPIELTSIGNKSIDVRQKLSFGLSIKNSYLPLSRLNFELVTGPLGAEVDPITGIFNWTPETNQIGNHTITLQGNNGEFSDTVTLTVTVNDAAILSIGHQTVNENEELNFTVVATYQGEPVSGLVYGVKGIAPDGVSLNPSTGEFSWLPMEEQSGQHILTIYASGNDTYTEEEITITVTEVNEPPRLNSIGDQSIDEEVKLLIIVQGSDYDFPQNSLTYSFEGLPEGAYCEVHVDHCRVYWTPEADQDGLYTITATVSDGMLTDSETFAITVYDIETEMPSSYAGGTGTSSNPYQISTLGHLRKLSSTIGDWSKHFVLTADIDATDTKNWNTGDHDNNASTPPVKMGFRPIGNSNNAFRASFNGGGHCISNLTIYRPNEYNIGLFGESYNRLEGIGLSNVNITGGNYVGGLTGDTSSNSFINGCYVKSGSVTGNSYVGGLVGFYIGDELKTCYTGATVTATGNAGGLAGAAWDSVTNCYSTGNVNGNLSGGLIGQLNRSSGIVTGCYSTGVAQGGLVYESLNGSTVNSSYWDKETSSTSTSAGSDSSFGLTTAEFIAKDFSSEWAFGSDDGSPWQDAGDSAYPHLYWQEPAIEVITELEVHSGDSLSFHIQVTDIDTPVSGLTYSLRDGSTRGSVTGATIDPVTGEFNWTPTEEQAGQTYPFTVEVTDGTYTSSTNFSITVEGPLTPAIGMQFTKNEKNLVWTVEDEISVASYRIINIDTGKTIDTVIANDSNEYHYTLKSADIDVMVVVVDNSGFSQSYVPKVGNYTEVVYDLIEGWNLISITGDYANISELEKATTGIFWGWNDSSYERIEKPLACQGIWVYAPKHEQVIITADNSNSNIILEPGWNLVGPKEDTYAPENAQSIFTWNAIYQEILKDEILIQGIGYWIFSTTGE